MSVYTIKSEPIGFLTRVIGLKNGFEWIVVSNELGSWQVMKVYPPQGTMKELIEYTREMQRVIERAKEHGAC